MKRNLPCHDTQQAAVGGKRSREFSPKAMDDSLKEMEDSRKEMEGKLKEMEDSRKEMESELLRRVEQMKRTQCDLADRIEKEEREHQQLQEKYKLLERKLEKAGQDAKKRECYKEMEASTSRCLQLKFTSQPSRKIFTKEKVKGEESGALKLVLVDSLTGQEVSSGAESSMEVQLVLVNSKIKRSKTCNWKFKYFEDNIVVPREGKQPLLVGDTTLSLNEGCAVVGNLKITDNSSWVPSGSFRLAAKVTNGYFNGKRVKEAITDAFVVNEDRLKAYQKHYPPFLKDEVWRLVGIAKGGAYHKRLQEKCIYTVKDFLESLQRNSNELRKFLKMPPSAWEDTVKHAQTCFLGGEMDGGWDQQGCSILPNTEVLAMPPNDVEVRMYHLETDIISGKMLTGPICDQQFNPARHISQATELEGSFLLQQQQHVTLQHFADGPSTFMDQLEDFILDVTPSPGEQLPAVVGDSFHTEFQEENGHAFEEESLKQLTFANEIPLEPEFGGCVNMVTEPTAGKDKDNLKWSSLIVAMAFSVRIVAANCMEAENP